VMSPGVSQAGAGPHEIGVRPAAAVRPTGVSEPLPMGTAYRSDSSAVGPDDWLKEVAVCELCGLVSRRPVPVVCPACGGGNG
jgi:hypothetical protein